MSGNISSTIVILETCWVLKKSQGEIDLFPGIQRRRAGTCLSICLHISGSKTVHLRSLPNIMAKYSRPVCFKPQVKKTSKKTFGQGICGKIKSLS